MTHRYLITFCYHPDGLPLKRPSLFGSWDSFGRFHEDWTDSGRPLERRPDGSWQVSCELESEPGQTFWWGVRDRGEWMLFGQSALAFQPSDPEQRHQLFRLGCRHLLGLNPVGDDGFRSGVWAPRARQVSLLIDPLAKSPRRYPLQKTPEDFWITEKTRGWAELEGRPYAFELLTSENHRVLRSDPYARRRQGPQRGVSDLFVTAEGQPTHRYAQDPEGSHLLRFEVIPPEELSEPPTLSLLRRGKRLTPRALRALFASSPPALPDEEAWWSDTLLPDGRMQLKRRRNTEAYALCVGPAARLEGLEYELQDAQGRTYHDPWSPLLDGYHNWPRFGVASRPLRGMRRQPKRSQPIGDLVLYEVHIGSLLGQGGNLRTSTLGEVARQLPRIKDLGFTAVALMPTNPSEGHRDWGYLGTSSMAHQEAYANPDESAEESLLEFLRAAHDLDLRVFTDVVYNHIGGDHNDLWNFDGYGNPWFEWNPEPTVDPEWSDVPPPLCPQATADCPPRTLDPGVRNTPWGPIPAFNKAPVSQFFLDHSIDCIERLGFDGIRFDFTHLIHAHPHGGGHHGWLMLQEIHRRLRHFFPDVLTFAEEFPQHPIITTPVSEGGAGFDAMWNTEHQHRLIFDHHRLSITEALVTGKPLPLEAWMQHLLHPAGFSRPSCSVTVLSNHDEVGNAIQIAQLVAPHPRGHDIARLVCWLSLLTPGYPIMFQGTEDLATNRFTWGVPSTWDGHSHLLGEPLHPERLRHLQSLRDVLHFRQACRDLHSEVPIAHHFLDSEAQTLGFRRASVWVVANFSDQTYALPEEVRVVGPALLSSEESRYGYQGLPSEGLQVGSLAVKVFASSHS